MNLKDKKLASRLLYLPISLQAKVLLWLTYRGIKPVSEFSFSRKQSVSKTELLAKYARRIEKWIDDADIFYNTDPKYKYSWCIGKNKHDVMSVSKLIGKLNAKDEQKLGNLLGFPKSSVLAWAHNRKGNFKQDQITMLFSRDKMSNNFLKNKYYSPYILYAVRADRVEEDSLPAKTWADTIRRDIPTLASWFEKHSLKELQK